MFSYPYPNVPISTLIPESDINNIFP